MKTTTKLLIGAMISEISVKQKIANEFRNR